MSEELLTVVDAAAILGVKEETVRRWLRAGKIEGIQLSRKAGWRITRPALQRFLKERTPPKSEPR